MITIHIRTLLSNKVYQIVYIPSDGSKLSRKLFATSVIHWAHERFGQGLNYYLDYHTDAYNMIICKDLNEIDFNDIEDIPLIE